ncbi:excalibur calcium-binding domain-containing protein [Nocardia wallacei]|uniref:excalibur calcium-binding domain-containing protein n=1 Tax=Nocardia wallacei TaxID=480035 RepID=UPI002457F156|nr:excalibur calcium-binding domain-containing protein [Nocardia wallacei]
MISSYARRAFAAACLGAASVVVLGAPVVSADPLTDLLCSSGSAQFCPQPRHPAPPRSNPAPYYKNCEEARRAGDTPLYRGQPGYAPHLDRDNDGVGCE